VSIRRENRPVREAVTGAKSIGQDRNVVARQFKTGAHGSDVNMAGKCFLQRLAQSRDIGMTAWISRMRDNWFAEDNCQLRSRTGNPSLGPASESCAQNGHRDKRCAFWRRSQQVGGTASDCVHVTSAAMSLREDANRPATSQSRGSLLQGGAIRLLVLNPDLACPVQRRRQRPAEEFMLGQSMYGAWGRTQQQRTVNESHVIGDKKHGASRGHME
jgi:hypothetical protein